LHPPYDIKLVLLQKITFALRKSTKTAATVFDSNMHQIVCRLGLRPEPYWGSLQRSPDHLAGGVLLLKGGEERGDDGESRRGEGREGVGPWP